MRKAKTFFLRLISRRHGMANFALSVALSIRINNEKHRMGLPNRDGSDWNLVNRQAWRIGVAIGVLLMAALVASGRKPN